MSATLDPDVSAAVQELLTSVRVILGEHFRGMYLSGSLALGDFDPRRSDLDLVLITDADLTDTVFAALRDMHARFDAGDSPWATEVEVAYIPQDALYRHDAARAYHPHLERGRTLVREQLDSGWVIQRHILREHGIVVTGPALKGLIGSISVQDLRRATLEAFHGWWSPTLERPGPFYHHGYQTYVVLTMCRVLYTLQRGTIASKQVAAHWAQERLGEPWTDLIERALIWRKASRGAELMPLTSAVVRETLDFIRYTRDRCQSTDADRGWRQIARGE